MRPHTVISHRATSVIARVVSCLLAAALLGSCAPKGGPGGRGGFKMPPLPVEVADVQPQAMRQQFRALGSIEADETIEATSEQSGVVRALPFTEGSYVAQGALLARLDDREAKASAERAAAQLEQAQANAARAEKLSEQQVISQSELDDVRSALKVARANDVEAQTVLEKTHVRAPWAGVVGRRRVSPGAYVKPGDVITEVARINDVKVRFAAPERYASVLKVGVPVELTTPAFAAAVFAGRLHVVDPIIDAQTRTVQLTALVPNTDHRLKPGMSANVAVTLAERPSALVVPDEAIFAEGAQNFVYVVKADTTVARTAVVLGMRDSSRVEIVSGLTPGERVVSAGHQKIFEGAKVMPIPAGMLAAGGPGGPGAPGPPGAGAAAGPDPGGAKPAAAPAGKAAPAKGKGAAKGKAGSGTK